MVSVSTIKDGVVGAVGDTPLIRIGCLSELTGCDILGKAEFQGVCGSIKDRPARTLIQDAIDSGKLKEVSVHC